MPVIEGPGWYNIGVACEDKQWCAIAVECPQVIHVAEGHGFDAKTERAEIVSHQHLTTCVVRGDRLSTDELLCQSQGLSVEAGGIRFSAHQCYLPELVMGMQGRIQLNGLTVSSTFHSAGEGIANKQHIRLSRQISGFDRLNGLFVFVQDVDPRAGSNVQASLDNAAIAEGYAGTGIGADQAISTDRQNQFTAA